MFNELDRHIAVRLDSGVWQVFLRTQDVVVVEHAVVGQRKPRSGHFPGKRMVVSVIFGLALSGHTAVPHNDPCIIRDTEAAFASGTGPLVEPEPAAGVVGNTRRIGASGLALCSQSLYKHGLAACAQRAAAVDESEQTAHYASASLSTGSLT